MAGARLTHAPLEISGLEDAKYVGIQSASFAGLELSILEPSAEAAFGRIHVPISTGALLLRSFVTVDDIDYPRGRRPRR